MSHCPVTHLIGVIKLPWESTSVAEMFVMDQIFHEFTASLLAGLVSLIAGAVATWWSRCAPASASPGR